MRSPFLYPFLWGRIPVGLSADIISKLPPFLKMLKEKEALTLFDQ